MHVIAVSKLGEVVKSPRTSHAAENRYSEALDFVSSREKTALYGFCRIDVFNSDKNPVWFNS